MSPCAELAQWGLTVFLCLQARQGHKEKQEQLKLERKMKEQQQGENGEEILKDITDKADANTEKIQKDASDEQEKEENNNNNNNNNNEEEGLTEEKLREVLKATSAFTMRKAMKAEDAAVVGFDELERDY